MATRTTNKPAAVLTIGYRVIDSPIGPLLVAASERGVHRIVLSERDHEFALRELERRVSPKVVEDSLVTEAIARELGEFFAGERREFSVRSDLSLVEGFTRRVIEALSHIPYGDRWSYGAVAEAIGHPRAHRAVGTACGANPVPLIHPCHRVIRSDGSVGSYGGGEWMKRTLLDLETRR